MDDMEIRVRAISLALEKCPGTDAAAIVKLAEQIEEYLRTPSSKKMGRLPDESTADAVTRLSALGLRVRDIAAAVNRSQGSVAVLRVKLGITPKRNVSPETHAANVERGKRLAAERNRRRTEVA